MGVHRALSYHAQHQDMAKPGTLTDIYDGSKWREYVLQDPVIAPDGNFTGQNLAFNISGDGISPFDDNSSTMWPIALSCLNLPPWIRMTVPALWLCCVVPGPKEPKDFQSVLDIIADDLNYLYRFGIEVVSSAPETAPNACTGRFNCKAKLFGLISDYRGIGPLTRHAMSPSHVGACYTCHQKGFSASGKTIYPGKLCNLSQMPL